VVGGNARRIAPHGQAQRCDAADDRLRQPVARRQSDASEGRCILQGTGRQGPLPDRLRRDAGTAHSIAARTKPQLYSPSRRSLASPTLRISSARHRYPRRQTSCALLPAALAPTRGRSGLAKGPPRPRSSTSRRVASSPATASCTLRHMGCSPVNSAARTSLASF